VTIRATGPSPRQPAGWTDSRAFAGALLTAASIFVLVPALHYFGPREPLGDDASSHIASIATLARRIGGGQGWWSTDFNLGFPFALYYQPLPHIVSALVCLALGGPHRAALTFKLLTVGMLIVQPWTIYLGMRRAGADRVAAACAGALAPMVMDYADSGYSAHASLSIGLYTQNWGNVVLPLAIGELVALCNGCGRFALAMLACAVVAACHMFYALALVPPVLLLALLRRGRLRALARLLVVGAGAFVLLTAWLVPLTLTQSYFGGWPAGLPDQVNGVGWRRMFDAIVTGHFLDAGRGPLLTIFAAIGVAFALSRVRRDRYAVALLVLAGWALLGTVGRAGLGAAIDLYPLHATVQLLRYAALLQFALLVAGGYGLAAAARWLGTRLTPAAGAALIVVALIAPARAGFAQLRSGFETLADTDLIDLRDYDEVVGWLRSERPDGRLYVGRKSGLPGHHHSGLLAYLGRRPAGVSYGVGLHDSLHFFTLAAYDPAGPHALPLADLFDFRLLLSAPEREFPALAGAAVVHSNGGYVLARLPVSGAAVVIMRAGGSVRGTPRGVRQQILGWLNGNGAAVGTTLVLEVTDARSRDDLLGAPAAAVMERIDFPDPAPPKGVVVTSAAAADTVTATVDLAEPALVVAKVSFHPFWRVTVDGAERQSTFAFPGLLAVEVPIGRHEIAAIFRWPAWTRVLLLLSPLPIVVGIWLDRRRPAWLYAAQ
jgi:hypothetical protein